MVQLHDHDNDTDDVPPNLDPLGFENFVQLDQDQFKSFNKTHPRENDTDDIIHRFNPPGHEHYLQLNS